MLIDSDETERLFLDRLRLGPPPRSPAVSLILPTFNLIHLTRRCLASIAATAPLDRTEIIVVDDASSDETPSVLSAFQRIHFVRNDPNLGFLRTVNRGAALATGEFIVILNNDTQMQPGWLDALLDAARSADVGAVGSKLVYPDGLLQEAGGIIWRDASAWNYGKWKNPNLPEYNFRRDVEYCSAASLLIRRALWEKLGGFDERYVPIYCEDSDVCMAIHHAGYRVVYEPRSVVVHYEGMTHGTDTRRKSVGAHSKDSQYRNQIKFAEKWSAALQAHLPNGTANGLLGGRRDGRPRLLVVVPRVPTHADGDQRVEAILTSLLLDHCAVTLFPIDRVRREPGTSELQSKGVEVIHGQRSFRRLVRERPGVYSAVLFTMGTQSAGFLRIVRDSLAQSLVAFDIGGFPATGDSELPRDDRVLFAKADVLVATRGRDLAALQRQFPLASIVTLPDPEGAVAEPGEPVASLASLLTQRALSAS